MNWGKVVLWDPHSDVTPALVHNAVVVPRVDLVRTTVDHLRIRHGEDLALVVPDQGAFKATMAIADEYGIETVCMGEKLRDMKTGEITGTFVHNVQHLKGKVVLIADDICDGGRTFTTLAEFITGKVSVKSLALYVTHGIFSKGIADLMTMDRFNLVACPNVFNSSNSGAGVLSCRAAGVEVNRKANTTFFTF
ncbi:ribose-phosphate pyrophosphokinase [compost metagenome]